MRVIAALRPRPLAATERDASPPLLLSAVSGEASCSLKRTDGSLYWASSFYGVLRLGLSIPGGKDVRKTELNHARIHSELANSLL